MGTINELYLFFDKSPKRHQHLEHFLEKYAPESGIRKLKGLCKTRWVERHDCLETLVSLYQYVVTCLHSITLPTMYPELTTDDSWAWDRKTLTEAGGLHAALTNFQNIAVLIDGLGK